MANLPSFSLITFITGDGVSTSVVVGLGYTPTTASLVTAYDANYNSVAANISSVVPGSSNVTINFVAAFSGTIQVLLALGSSTYANAPLQPVTGTFWQATQPVSGTVSVNALPTGTNQIGHVIADTGSTTVVTGTVANNQTQIAGTAILAGAGTTGAGSQRVTIADTATASSSTVGSVSLGQSSGKAVVMKTGNLVTTAVTADQVVLTYTVTAGKTFYLQYLDLNCRLTTYANTSVLFGSISLENPSGTKLVTELADAQSGGFPNPIYLAFAEPIPIAAGTVIRVVCTPAAVTSFTWQANFGGYEK